MRKSKRKAAAKRGLRYSCDFCGGRHSMLFIFGVCQKCEMILRRHCKSYRAKRMAIEEGKTI
jgi:hypothetical protein